MLPHILSKVLCHLRGFTSPTFCLHRPSTSLTVSIVSTTQTPQKSNHTQLHKNPHFSQFKKTESSERLMKARPGLTPWRVLHGDTGAPGWFGRNGRLGSGVGFWWWVAISLWFVAAVVFVRWIHRDPSFWTVGKQMHLKGKGRGYRGWWFVFYIYWKISSRLFSSKRGVKHIHRWYEGCLVAQISGGSINWGHVHDCFWIMRL